MGDRDWIEWHRAFEADRAELHFDSSPEGETAVGVNRYEGEPQPLPAVVRLFQFR